jgi:hypothetical protein
LYSAKIKNTPAGGNYDFNYNIVLNIKSNSVLFFGVYKSYRFEKIKKIKILKLFSLLIANKNSNSVILSIVKNPLFFFFKKSKGNPSVLQPQDDSERFINNRERR